MKNGRSVVDALCDYYVEGGGFKHVSFLEVNGMATEQGYYALAAYMRFLEGKTALYDMSDVTLTGDNTGDSTDNNTGGNAGGSTEGSTGDSTEGNTGDSSEDNTTAESTGNMIPTVPVKPSTASKPQVSVEIGESDDETSKEVNLTPTAEAAKKLLEALDSDSKSEEILKAILAYEELSKEEKAECCQICRVMSMWKN